LQTLDDVIGAERVEIGAGEGGAVEPRRREQELHELAAIAAVAVQQRRRRIHGGPALGTRAAVPTRLFQSEIRKKERERKRERERIDNSPLQLEGGEGE